MEEVKHVCGTLAVFQQAVFKAEGAAGSLDIHVTMSQVPEDEGPQPGGLNSRGALSSRAGGWQSGLSISSQISSGPPHPACHRQALGLLAGSPTLPFSVSGLHAAFSAPCVCLWAADTSGERMS